jgi:tRNA A37 methylthiotransferase MiaB
VTGFSVEFLGCKVSQADAQALRERLVEDGHEERPRGSGVHVVNGCCVTHEAVRKTRTHVRRALRAGADRVLVTGCAANLAGGALADLGPRVRVVRGTSEEAGAAVAASLGPPAA